MIKKKKNWDKIKKRLGATTKSGVKENKHSNANMKSFEFK